MYVSELYLKGDKDSFMARVLPIKAKPFADIDRPVIELTKHGKLLVYEESGGRWFRSSESAVEDALTRFQEFYENNEEASLNNVYLHLDIRQTNTGRVNGWNALIHGAHTRLLGTVMYPNGYKMMNEPVLVIKAFVMPEKDYKDCI